MDVCTAIRERRSVRAYSDRKVEREKVEAILEAARLSPSASNRQEWKFIVVTEKAKRVQLANAAFGQSFIMQAPVVLVACATESASIMPCGQPTYTVDVSIAFAFMVLQAWELGLGTCWIGAFQEQEVKSVLGIPEGARVVAMSPLGYPDHPIPPRPRKSLEQIACFESYA